MKNNARDMTIGSPLKTILLFSVPILFGNLLMQAYNLVDAIIVGQFVGVDAFGATSASNTLINLFISVLIGVGSGASIIMSQLFGRKNFDKLKCAFSTSIICLTVIAFIISILGFIFSKDIMIMLNVDALILEDSAVYLQIFFVGLVPLMLFNMYSSFLRGIGNSVAPLIFLCVATVSNILLDLLFVVVFKLGVPGVAIATAIANCISAVLIIIYTNKKIIYFALVKASDFVFDRKLLKKIMIAGFPVIFQSVLVSLSLVLVQSTFNSFGKDYTSAYGLSGRLDALATLPLTSISTALATFVAQNKGAGHPARITKGYWQSMWSMTVITYACVGLMALFFDQLIGLFINQDALENAELVIRVTKEFFTIMSLFYILMGFMFITSNTLSGSSDIKAPIIIMSISMIVRTAFTFLMLDTLGYKAGIWAFPLSWFVGAVLAIAYFMSGKWKTKTFLTSEDLDS